MRAETSVLAGVKLKYERVPVRSARPQDVFELASTRWKYFFVVWLKPRVASTTSSSSSSSSICTVPAFDRVISMAAVKMSRRWYRYFLR